MQISPENGAEKVLAVSVSLATIEVCVFVRDLGHALFIGEEKQNIPMVAKLTQHYFFTERTKTMKKLTSFLLALIFIVSLCSCGSIDETPTQDQKPTVSEPPKPTQITVNYGGGSDKNLSINENTGFDEIINSKPQKEGYIFAGWYSDAEYTDYIIPGYITNTQYSKGNAYAKWITIDSVWITARTSEATITDSGRKNQQMDIVNFKANGISLTDWERAGYSSVKIQFSIDLKEVNDGYQYIFFYKDSSVSSKELSILEIYDKYVFGEEGSSEDPSLIYMHRYEHGAGEKDTSYETLSFEVVLDIDSFRDDLYIRYGASGSKEDDWVNKNVRVKISPVE